jgi:ankyrin repeat protein
MNKSYNTKNKFLKNIMFGSFLLGSFAGTFSQLQADPIHSLASKGNIPEVQRLLNEGADPNAPTGNGLTPLHYAGDPAMIDLLYANGADPNRLDNSGNTPLHAAVNSGNLARIRRLLEIGANKDQRNSTGHSPASIIEQIISKTTNENTRQTCIAARKLFSQVRPKSLHEAVADDDTAIVLGLLAAGADPNEENRFGYTPLQCAETPEIIGLLCSKGADANKPNQWGNTLLHDLVCAYDPDLEFIKQLVLNGAKPDIRNKKGDTPLSMVQRAIAVGIVADGRPGATSASISDDARLKYVKVLALLLLPPRLWSRLDFGQD